MKYNFTDLNNLEQYTMQELSSLKFSERVSFAFFFAYLPKDLYSLFLVEICYIWGTSLDRIDQQELAARYICYGPAHTYVFNLSYLSFSKFKSKLV